MHRQETMVERREEGEVSMQEWQDRWDTSAKRRWTQCLIRNEQAWVDRKHGETNVYMTLYLTGHGSFREYLHKYGHDDGVACCFCGSSSENVEHILFLMPVLYSRAAEFGKGDGTPYNTRRYSVLYAAI